VSSRVAKPDPLWCRPCVSYNLQVHPTKECRETLGHVQDRLGELATGLLRCPPHSLHVSVAIFLSVRREYELTKGEIWARWGPSWISGIKDVAERLAPFEIHFIAVRVSDAAVVAVAEPVQEIEVLRAGVSELVAGAGLAIAQPAIVHCTLLRYATSDLDLDYLTKAAEDVELRATTLATTLVLSKELVYPSLVNDRLERIDLRARPVTDD
jgi:hypothetical protein